MRNTHWLAVSALLVVAVTACAKDDATIRTTSLDDSTRSASSEAAEGRGMAMIRFVNAADGRSVASLRVDDTVLFDRVSSSTVSPYREFNATMARFDVRDVALSDTTTIASDDEMLQEGHRYSVVLMSENMSKRILRVLDDEVIPDSGMARLRVIHAAPGGPMLDVRAANGTTELFTDLKFNEGANHVDVLPATVTLEVRAANSAPVLLTVPSLPLARGTATTVVLSGATQLSWFTFVDTMMPATAIR